MPCYVLLVSNVFYYWKLFVILSDSVFPFVPSFTLGSLYLLS